MYVKLIVSIIPYTTRAVHPEVGRCRTVYVCVVLSILCLPWLNGVRFACIYPPLGTIAINPPISLSDYLIHSAILENPPPSTNN